MAGSKIVFMFWFLVCFSLGLSSAEDTPPQPVSEVGTADVTTLSPDDASLQLINASNVNGRLELATLEVVPTTTQTQVVLFGVKSDGELDTSDEYSKEGGFDKESTSEASNHLSQKSLSESIEGDQDTLFSDSGLENDDSLFQLADPTEDNFFGGEQTVTQLPTDSSTYRTEISVVEYINGERIETKLYNGEFLSILSEDSNLSKTLDNGESLVFAMNHNEVNATFLTKGKSIPFKEETNTVKSSVQNSNESEEDVDETAESKLENGEMSSVSKKDTLSSLLKEDAKEEGSFIEESNADSSIEVDLIEAINENSDDSADSEIYTEESLIFSNDDQRFASFGKDYDYTKESGAQASLESEVLKVENIFLNASDELTSNVSKITDDTTEIYHHIGTTLAYEETEEKTTILAENISKDKIETVLYEVVENYKENTTKEIFDAMITDDKSEADHDAVGIVDAFETVDDVTDVIISEVGVNSNISWDRRADVPKIADVVDTNRDDHVHLTDLTDSKKVEKENIKSTSTVDLSEFTDDLASVLRMQSAAQGVVTEVSYTTEVANKNDTDSYSIAEDATNTTPNSILDKLGDTLVANDNKNISVDEDQFFLLDSNEEQKIVDGILAGIREYIESFSGGLRPPDEIVSANNFTTTENRITDDWVQTAVPEVFPSVVGNSEILSTVASDVFNEKIEDILYLGSSEAPDVIAKGTDEYDDEIGSSPEIVESSAKALTEMADDSVVMEIKNVEVVTQALEFLQKNNTGASQDSMASITVTEVHTIRHPDLSVWPDRYLTSTRRPVYDPYILGPIFGNQVNFTIETMWGGEDFGVPADAYIIENQQVPSINFTWISYPDVHDYINCSVFFTLAQTPKYYTVKGVELNIVTNDMSSSAFHLRSFKKNLTLAHGDGPLPVEIRFDNKTVMVISSFEFLRTPKLIEHPILPIHIEVAVGTMAAALIAGISLFLVIKRTRTVKLFKEKSKSNLHIAV